VDEDRIVNEQRPPYPVRVDAALDAPLSRWLWLVKWLLALPHYVVLVFLWLAFAVLTVVAFFAILFTGRYPRALFDFDVGVLRWTWRVHHYAYAALGTDRYPPFTLADVPDYPAHFDVAYPERLSRGLVLVKWWLLALPHYLVVALFVGGGLWIGTGGWGDDGRYDDGWGAGGLVALLVLVAGIVLLFTGRYPQPIYDFVLGMDRWALRVAAYAGLMTDRYPPFRLDLGGSDPGSVPAGPVPPVPPEPGVAAEPGMAAVSAAAPVRPTPSAPAAGPMTSRWTAGRVVSVVIGAVLLVTGSGLVGTGGTVLWAHTALRDGDGYVWTPDAELATDRYALIGDSLELEGAGLEWVVDNVLGTARLEVRGVDDDTEVFVGIARTSDVAGYLAGVGHEQLSDIGPRWDRGHLEPGWRTDHPGGAPAVPPGESDIWRVQSSGTGVQVLEWTPEEGDWTAVIMRADAGPGVAVEARVGATVPALPWIGGVLLGLGVLFLLLGALLVGLATRRARPGPPDAAVPAAGAPVPGPVPPGSREPELATDGGAGGGRGAGRG
jgi:hypothetical protein